MSQMFSFCGIYLSLIDMLVVQGQIQYSDQVTMKSNLVFEIICLD